MTDVRKAEAIVAQLQAKRARLVGRGVEIGDQRAAIAYDAQHRLRHWSSDPFFLTGRLEKRTWAPEINGFGEFRLPTDKASTGKRLKASAGAASSSDQSSSS